MCKILGFTNMKKIKVTPSLIKSISNLLTKEDVDGFGYSVMSKKGEVWGEKFSDIKKVELRINSPKANEIPELAKDLVKDYYAKWGTFKASENIFGIFHSRHGTSDVNIENTHPFISEDNGLHLIHNGVVSEQENKVEKKCLAIKRINKYKRYMKKEIIKKQELLKTAEGAEKILNPNSANWILDNT